MKMLETKKGKIMTFLILICTLVLLLFINYNIYFNIIVDEPIYGSSTTVKINKFLKKHKLEIINSDIMIYEFGLSNTHSFAGYYETYRVGRPHKIDDFEIYFDEKLDGYSLRGLVFLISAIQTDLKTKITWGEPYFHDYEKQILICDPLLMSEIDRTKLGSFEELPEKLEYGIKLHVKNLKKPTTYRNVKVIIKCSENVYLLPGKKKEKEIYLGNIEFTDYNSPYLDEIFTIFIDKEKVIYETRPFFKIIVIADNYKGEYSYLNKQTEYFGYGHQKEAIR